MNFSFVHEFDINPQGFWDLFFSAPYEEELYKRLKMKSRTVIEHKADENFVRRTQRMEPQMNIPSWATSVVKDAGYTEYDVLDKKASRMDVRIEPAMMKDRFHITSAFTVTPAGPGRCKRGVFRGDPHLGAAAWRQAREAHDRATARGLRRRRRGHPRVGRQEESRAQDLAWLGSRGAGQTIGDGVPGESLWRGECGDAGHARLVKAVQRAIQVGSIGLRLVSQ